MQKKFFLIIILLITQGCSYFSKEKSRDSFTAEDALPTRRDYWIHWKKISKDFLSTYPNSFIKPEPRVQSYLRRLLSNIENKNELFFQQDPPVDVTFLVIKDERPFYFSLPTGEIIISKRLLEKYIDNEGFLLSVIVPEYVRLRKAIYPKVSLIPRGYMTVDKLLSLIRLNFDNRMKLHEWTYYLLLRSNYHPGQYLSWVQIQNRNHLDFAYYLADSTILYKEESYLKQYIINNYGKIDLNPLKLKSSAEFYLFTDRYRTSL